MLDAVSYLSLNAYLLPQLHNPLLRSYCPEPSRMHSQPYKLTIKAFHGGYRCVLQKQRALKTQ